MLEYLIVADDLTGGNATGCRLAANGLDTVCLMDPLSSHLQLPPDVLVLVAVTNSRQLAPAEAAARVRTSAMLAGERGAKQYCKRIDSTLRGNIAAEVDALLDTLGPEYVAAVVAVHPEAKRAVRAGRMYVDDYLLQDTSIAADPSFRVYESFVSSAFEGMTRRQIATLTIKDYEQGGTHCLSRLLSYYRGGARVFVFDGESRDDLDFVAALVRAAEIPFLAVDPGPFTAVLAGEKEAPKQNSIAPGRTLAIVGSIYPETAAQIGVLARHQDCLVVPVCVAKLVDGGLVGEEEIERAASQLLATSKNHAVYALVGDGIDPQKRVDVSAFAQMNGISEDAVVERITRAFGKAAKTVLERQRDFDTIFACGGDIAQAVCTGLGASMVRLEQEIFPLVAMGRLMDGPFAGIRLITKGGSVGPPDCVADILCL